MPCKVRKRNKTVWLAAVMKGGVRKQKTFDTRTEALGWEAEARKEKAFTTPMASSRTVLEWATAYLDFCRKFHATTRWEKRQCFKALFRVVDPGLDASALTKGQVLTALQAVCDAHGGNVANKHRKNLVAAWVWGHKYLELPESNPCRVDRFPEKRMPRYVPPVEDFWAVYNACGRNDQRMLLAYIHTAARKGELFKLTWDDVDFSGKRIGLWTSKRKEGTKECDWLPMTTELQDALTEQRSKNDGALVFPDPETGEAYKSRQHFLEKKCERLNIKPFCWHSIRHLAASMLQKNGMPILSIQRILRHKNLATTIKYLHQLDTDREHMDAFPRRNENPAPEDVRDGVQRRPGDV